jgi:hypothetical protein
MGKDFWASLPAIGRGIDDVISWPFRLLGGGGSPLPHYEPTITKSGILDDFKQARRAASLQTIDPSGIETVRKFCAAPPQRRAHMDISAVPSNARAMLLTMGDDELSALGKAGPGQIKKFVDGKQHGVFGVPVVGDHAAVPANNRSPRPSFDHRRWKTQAVMKKDIENRFKLG